jgi:hypothetical protein
MAYSATSDDPRKLISRALRLYSKAVRDGDAALLRDVAEAGWLAICSAADVASKKLNLDAPSGFSARNSTLKKLEQEAGAKRGTFTLPLEVAKDVLHGACFYGDDCNEDKILSVLNWIEDTISDIQKALNNL